ncbi:hypothetical protein TWF970_011182 [Orbilia oligospora]|uniref:Clr5 domain-containing protein n=1 Tax=Orbilia oligospora TaxID=2813651 RepID=A0A7C8VJY8_ORBOL|nr:hypothetical protein TWF970_011182 [Orbilia oligospora]
MSKELKFKQFTKEKRKYTPASQWDSHKEFILQKLAEKTSQKGIIEALRLERGVNIKLRQLKRQIEQWGVGRRNLNRRQRAYIWTVYRQRRREGKMSTSFRFKIDGRVVTEKQVETVIYGDGSDIVDSQNSEGQTPGLVYFTPMAMTGDPVDPTVEDYNRIDNIEGEDIDNTVSSAPSEIPECQGLNQMKSKKCDKSYQTIGIAELLGERSTKSTCEDLQALCEDVLNSVQGIKAAVSADAGPLPIEQQPKDYSAYFATELENRIKYEKRMASLFLQEMDEEKAKSGDTLSAEESKGFPSMSNTLRGYRILLDLSKAYFLNRNPIKGIKINNFVKEKLTRLENPTTSGEWRRRASSWYGMGITALQFRFLSEAKSCLEAAYAANLQIQRKSGTDVDGSFECVSKLGYVLFMMGDPKLAIEKEKKRLDFRKQHYGVQDIWYLRSIALVTRYMTERGLVRFSQPILRLTIETCETMGIDEKRYHCLLREYYGVSFTVDMAEFGDAYGLGWHDVVELE